MTDSTTILLLMPEIGLIAAATIIYVAGAFVPLKRLATGIAIVALIYAAVCLYGQNKMVNSTDLLSAQTSQTAIASGPLVIDLFGYTARWGILAVGLLLILLTDQRATAQQRSEEAGSILLMLAGLMLIAAGNELILIFVGLELVSIPTYVVLYVGRHDADGQEAAAKYFFLSILASAVMLYGFSFLYGVGGSTRLAEIAQKIASLDGDPSNNFNLVLAPLAMLLIFAGLAFRLTAVPFHFYAPDVYQGTSNANAGLLATLPKIAGLAVLVRILLAAMPGWESLGWKLTLVISILTMTFGNMLALWQTNIRRMLAYSSIAHAGYLLIGVAVAMAARTVGSGATATTEGLNGLGTSLFYLAVYMFATLGAFAALVYLSRGDRQISTLADLAGLNRIHPVVAIIIAVFMFSLTGIPPMAGFWGKFVLLFGALTLDESAAPAGVVLRPWFIGLAIVTVLNAAIGAAYYLRVIGYMYFRSSEVETPIAQRDVGPAIAMAACAALTLGLGFLPRPLVDATNRAGRSIGQPPTQQAVAPAPEATSLKVAVGNSP
jgi:NADH-quinone oxidoreductase subunit N